MTSPAAIPALREFLLCGPSLKEVPGLNWGTGVPLRVGATHEWFDDAEDGHEWTAPIGVLAALAAGAVRDGLVQRIVWIGRRVFPFPGFLDRRALAVSVLVDPPDADARLWTIDLVLRGAAPTCVLADGQGLTLAASRRLQLAAACGRGLGLLARPGRERRSLSAAATRWRVLPHPTERTDRAAWIVTLLRNKDQPTLAMDERSWVLESADAQDLVAVPPLVAGGACPPAARAAAS